MNLKKMETLVNLIYKIKQNMNVMDCLGFGKMIPPDNILEESLDTTIITLKGNSIYTEDYFDRFSFKKSKTYLYKDMKEFYSDEPYDVDELIDYLIVKFKEWLEKQKTELPNHLHYVFTGIGIDGAIESFIEMEETSETKIDYWKLLKRIYKSIELQKKKRK